MNRASAAKNSGQSFSAPCPPHDRRRRRHGPSSSGAGIWTIPRPLHIPLYRGLAPGTARFNVVISGSRALWRTSRHVRELFSAWKTVAPLANRLAHQHKNTANRPLLHGLENRFGPLGPTRVQIPPPPPQPLDQAVCVARPGCLPWAAGPRKLRTVFEPSHRVRGSPRTSVGVHVPDAHGRATGARLAHCTRNARTLVPREAGARSEHEHIQPRLPVRGRAAAARPRRRRVRPTLRTPVRAARSCRSRSGRRRVPPRRRAFGVAARCRRR
jgi:hypothetical protein